MVRSNIKKNIFIAILAACIAPTTIVLHEVSHYVSAAALGMNPKLSYMHVDMGFARLAKRLVATSSGPAIDFSLCLLGLLFLIYRRRSASESRFGVIDWVLFILTLSSLRWILQPLLSWAIPNAGGIGLSDEHKISLMLGLPSLVIPILAIIFGVFALRRSIMLHPKGNRMNALAITVPAMICGMAVWAFILGPAIFGLTHRSTRTLQPRALSSRLHSDFSSPFIVRLAAPPVNSIR